jgi:hypothetical protein
VEWLAFALVVLVVLTGVCRLGRGYHIGRDWVAVTGGGVTGLFWPALRYAQSYRRDNIRIRLYELPSRAGEDDRRGGRVFSSAPSGAVGAPRSPTARRAACQEGRYETAARVAHPESVARELIAGLRDGTLALAGPNRPSANWSCAR